MVTKDITHEYHNTQISMEKMVTKRFVKALFQERFKIVFPLKYLNKHCNLMTSASRPRAASFENETHPNGIETSLETLLGTGFICHKTVALSWEWTLKLFISTNKL